MKHLQQIIDERDRRYTELREADQTALKAALAAQEKAVAAALDAAERAVSKAEVAAEKRFDGVNEFRATLSDQASTLMPRAECELRLKSLEDKQSARESRGMGMDKLWAIIISTGGFLALLYSLYRR